MSQLWCLTSTDHYLSPCSLCARRCEPAFCLYEAGQGYAMKLSASISALFLIRFPYNKGKTNSATQVNNACQCAYRSHFRGVTKMVAGCFLKCRLRQGVAV